MKRTVVAITQVVAALSVCALALYLADSGVDFKWITIGGLTLLLFGSVCYHTRDLWNNARYWATLVPGFGEVWYQGKSPRTDRLPAYAIRTRYECLTVLLPPLRLLPHVGPK